MPMDWNWAAIDALAALAGVAGLITSIIFLIYEVRHNARAIEGATVQNLMGLEREVFALTAEHAELFTKGSQDIQALSEIERFRYDRLTATIMSLIYSAFIQYERGLIDGEVWDAYRNALRRWSKGPGFRDSWEGFKDSYPSSFRTEVLPIFGAVLPTPTEGSA
jgi:hypothetical protein